MKRQDFPVWHSHGAPILLFVLVNGLFLSLFFFGYLRTTLPSPQAAFQPWLASAAFFSASGLLALLLGGFGAALHRFSTRPIRWVFGGTLSLFFTIVWIYLWIDAKTYREMGLHIESDYILKALMNPSFQRESQISAITYASILGGFVMLLFLQGACLRACHRVASHMRHPVFTLFFGLLVIACPFFLWTLHQETKSSSTFAEALPFFQRLSRAAAPPTSLVTAHYPHILPAHDPILAQRPDIVFLAGESLRGDMLQPAWMPQLSRFAQQHGCLTSAQHHSGGHSTTWGLFSLLYGLHAYHLTFFHKQDLPPYPLRLLKKNGYRSVAMLSTKLTGWDHGELLLRHFDQKKEFFAQKSDQNDLLLLKEVKSFLQKPPHSPYFLFLFLNATHHNYLYPPAFARHQPVMPENYNHFLVDHKLLPFKEKIFNRYKNSVLFLDDLAAQITTHLQRTGRKTLFVFTGDHGEEFWDHGLLGHGAPNFINARTRVPFLLCAPTPLKRPISRSSHADIWPTVIDLLSPKTPLSPAAYSNGVSLLRPTSLTRHLLVTSYAFPQHRRRLAWIDHEKKLWLRMHGAFTDFRPFKHTDLLDRETPPLPASRTQPISETLAQEFRRFLRVGTFVYNDPPNVPSPNVAQIGPYLRVLGYHLSTNQASPQTQPTLTLTTFFHVLQAIPPEWRLFFHLETDPPKAFWNADHPPIQGFLPLHAWKPRTYLRDTYTFPIPAHFPAGRPLKMYIGLWSPQKGRLPILVPDAKKQAADRRFLLFSYRPDSTHKKVPQ
jgi:membrane-anchored protein YejM (alkaline phosphatase superfamily)